MFMQTKTKLFTLLVLGVMSFSIHAQLVLANTPIASVAVENVSNHLISNTQIKVVLDATNFNFALPHTDGSDIQFTDAAGITVLPFWKQTYDAVNKNAIFWVKVPSIPSLQTYTIKMYYGASLNASSYDTTMQKLAPTSSTVALFHLDDGVGTTAIDSAGSHVLNLINSPTWTAADGGNFQGNAQTFATGHALSFNGIDQYAIADNAIDTNSTEGSVELWFKFNVVPTAQRNANIFSVSTDDRIYNQGINCYVDPSGKLHAEFLTGGYYSGVAGKSIINDTKYHHIVVSWSPKYGTEIYLDGKIDGRNRFVGSFNGAYNSLVIGALKNAYGFNALSYSNISVDEIQTSNTAPTEKEIQSHFARTKPLVIDGVTPNTTNPIIFPNQYWEGNATYEPSVINDNGVLKMTYTAGWDYAGLGMAQSTDGINWTKISNGPVVGQGMAGELYASRSTFLKVGNEYRIYFADKNPDANIRLATSTDGLHFTVQAQNVVSKNDVPGAYGWANSGVYFDGTTWWMLLDSYLGHDEWWATHLFKSTDGGHTFQHVAGPLGTLQVNTGGMYGGNRAFVKIGDTYHTWYHAGYITSTLPTAVWHATSKDMINWVPDAQALIPIKGSEMGLYLPDQTADTSMIEFHGKTFLFHDADDNSYGMSRIGVATFNGTLEHYVNQAYTVAVSGITNVADTIAPTIRITAPQNFARLSGQTTISAVATDNVGITSIQFKVDGVAIGAPGTISPYSLLWNTVTVQNGIHTLSATAKDAAGNTRTATITVKIMNTSPCVGNNRKLCPLPTLPGIVNDQPVNVQGNSSPATAVSVDGNSQNSPTQDTVIISTRGNVQGQVGGDQIIKTEATPILSPVITETITKTTE